jgi:hypothetical protein
MESKTLCCMCRESRSNTEIYPSPVGWVCYTCMCKVIEWAMLCYKSVLSPEDLKNIEKLLEKRGR